MDIQKKRQEVESLTDQIVRIETGRYSEEQKEEFARYLNKKYPGYQIEGAKLRPSEILLLADPGTYEIALDQYFEGRLQTILNELEILQNNIGYQYFTAFDNVRK